MSFNLVFRVSVVLPDAKANVLNRTRDLSLEIAFVMSINRIEATPHG